MCFGSTNDGRRTDTRPSQHRMTPQGGARPARRAQPFPSEHLPPPRNPKTTPSLSLENMSQAIIQEASAATRDITSTRYAIIGGCAIKILGADRGTKDIDLLVPNEKKRLAKQDMRRSEHFWVGDSSDRRQMFKASNKKAYNVDILQPKDIGLSADYRDGDTIVVGGVRILKPALLLNLKVHAWDAEDRQAASKTRDLTDIRFLLDYMRRQRISTSRQEAYLITEDRLSLLIGNGIGSPEEWRDIGFPNSRVGSSRSSTRPEHGHSTHQSSTGSSSRSGHAGRSSRRPGY
jgi:hypothetical protein